MDTRLTTTYGIWRSLIAATLALALLATLGATSASAASPTACRVQNTNTGKTYAALQAAVDTASKGDRLTVRGVCVGGTVIDKALVIEGVATPTLGYTVLDGDHRTRVLLITEGVRVKLRSLVIRDGRARPGLFPKHSPHGRRCEDSHIKCGDEGGGIHNFGALALRDVLVRDNSARGAGGGIDNRRSGTLTLYNSRITHNESGAYGGGIHNLGTLALQGTSVRSNTVNGSGGGISNDDGSVTLNDSRISGNRSRYGGGGVWNGGSLVLNGSSRISGNRARGEGGGVYGAGALVLNGSSLISRNTGEGRGGGVFGLGGTVTLNDNSRISGNTVLFYERGSGGSGPPTGRAGTGGGVYVDDTDESIRVLLNDSGSITGNTAEGAGGGLAFYGDFVTSSVFTCAPSDGANVYRNTPDDCYIEP